MQVDAAPHGYPRPQLVRSGWQSLDGPWQFALDADGRYASPAEVAWDRSIVVPFAPETRASGVGDEGFYQACWYRRAVTPPPLGDGERLRLHFCAVDHRCDVWVDNRVVATHEGGYTPFSVDLTPFVRPGQPLDLVVSAHDEPSDLAKPRGKQDWQLQPHSIWYPRTTGIWQSVWMERLPSTWLESIRWTPSLERWEVGFQATIAGAAREGLRVSVKLRSRGQLLADDTYRVIAGEVHRRIALSDPGIDDYRNELLWSPASPTLIDAQIELWGERGELLDVVASYTALRAIAIDGDRVLLNGRPFALRFVLDQGYWADSGLTAPDDQALRRDVELAREMGFNGVRKHQKIESERYLYWADALGLLVWEEMPSAYRFTPESVQRATREWMEVIARDYSHPCIISWVPFNESWGVPNLPSNPSERHYVQAVYHLTKTLDPTRPVVSNDGWESLTTDIIGIHDYESDPSELTRRYHAEESRSRIFRRERPGGRTLVLEGHKGQPIVLTEVGGICFAQDDAGAWGYCRAATSEELEARYRNLLLAVRSLAVFAGFCYTQFADTYQEANGLLYVDRTPKFPIEEIANATRGPRLPR